MATPTPSPPIRQPHKHGRWPWIIGIVVALIFGGAIGATIESGDTADTTALDKREAELDEREAALDELAADLDTDGADEPAEDEPSAEPADDSDEVSQPDDTSNPERGSFDGPLGGFTWEDGLTVNVSDLRAFEPSSSSAGAEGYEAAVAFTVTVINNTDAAFDPSGFYTTMQSGTSEASQIFDSAAGIEGAPMTSILPGREVAFDLAFAVEDPSDVVLELSPGWDHDSALFVGGL